LNTARRHALNNRYDGPLPMGGAFAPDFDRSWREQVTNCKRWAWMEVRKIGHCLAQIRAKAVIGDQWVDEPLDREHMSLRTNLAIALRNWAAYRDWSRDA